MADLMTEPHDGHGPGDRCPGCPHSAAPGPREDVGLTDADWTRLRHAAGNRGDLGPIAEEVERILGERVRAASEQAWDEGWWKGQRDRDPTVLGYAENPYRGSGK